MKKVTLFVAALACAAFLTASIASAESPTGYSAGLSPNLVNPLPNNTKATPPPTLATDANRLIRWQGWQDVDAFCASILEQIQRQVNDNSIELGKFTIDEPSIAAAVLKAQVGGNDVTTCSTRCCVKTAVLKAQAGIPGFEVNPNLLPEGEGESFSGNVTLYVWTYRHNYTDGGLYQLYVSVKGKMLIGRGLVTLPPDPIFHKDIQALGYEFGPGFSHSNPPVWQDIYAEVEIWRGAVVDVLANGVMAVAGNEAEVRAIDRNGNEAKVEEAPIADWEVAPSLIGNPTYNPLAATGPKYAHPADHYIKVQKVAGDVQEEKRVRTKPVPRRALSGAW